MSMEVDRTSPIAEETPSTASATNGELLLAQPSSEQKKATEGHGHTPPSSPPPSPDAQEAEQLPVKENGNGDGGSEGEPATTTTKPPPDHDVDENTQPTTSNGVTPVQQPLQPVVRGTQMPILQQHGKVFVGPGARKEAQVLGLGLSSLHRSERADLDRAKRFAMEQSIKYVMQKQQTAHQENQQKVAMYAQALSLMARVYIGSISFELREDKIRELFAEFGPIKSVNMSFDASTGHHKGYAFLEYEVPEAALLAQDGMNGYLICGRNLKVERGRVQLQLGRPQSVPQAQPIIDMIMTEARKYHRVYVANIHEIVGENELRTVFSSFGNILKCQLAKNASGRHRGFGYIEFDSAKAASEAISGMNIFDLGGKYMRIGKCITPPDALSYIVPNSTSQLPTAAAMAAAAITARIQAQEAAGTSGMPNAPSFSPDRSRKRPRKKSKSPPKQIAAAPVVPSPPVSAEASPQINGKSTRFGEQLSIAPPTIVDPLAKLVASPDDIEISAPKKAAAPAKHRPSFAPLATVEVKEEPKQKTKKSKDILSRIKLQPAFKPGEKATFAPIGGVLGNGADGVFDEDGPVLAIAGGQNSKSNNSNALAVITDSKQVALTEQGSGQAGGRGLSASGVPMKKRKKAPTSVKAKGPQLNTVQALEAASKAGAISDLIHHTGEEDEEQPLAAMEINQIRGNDARHLLMRKLMRDEHTRVILLKKMVLPEEVDEFLQDEVRDECAKHGSVSSVTIVQVRGEIRIFVAYDKMDDAKKAREVFDKRFFNGRQIEATFYDEELLAHQDYLG